MVRVMIAAFIGIVAWVSLHMYYFFRKRDGKDNVVKHKKISLREYAAGFRFWQTVCLYLIALGGEAFFFLRADSFGLPYVNCVRNGMVYVWLLVIALIDGREKVIPRALTTAGLAAWLVLAGLAVLAGGDNLLNILFFSGSGLLLGGGMFFLCRLISKGGIGMGDIRMFSVLGLLYGMNYTFSIVFFTILFMSVFGLVCALLKKKDLKAMVAMGPFTLAAFCVSCLLGV